MKLSKYGEFVVPIPSKPQKELSDSELVKQDVRNKIEDRLEEKRLLKELEDPLYD